MVKFTTSCQNNLVRPLQGDPSAVPKIVENIKTLLGVKPMFGICMGHQILGQVVGGKTFKLKFGHHGANHPIRYDKDGAPPARPRPRIQALPMLSPLKRLHVNREALQGAETC